MIAEYFSKIWHEWKVLLGDRAYRISLFAGIVLMIGAQISNQLASVYNDSQTYISVGDLILDYIPTVDMHFFFAWGMYFLTVFIICYALFAKPETAPFALKTYAVLIFLRCGFILLTNIGPPVDSFYVGGVIGGDFFTHFIFKNDLFFSGHTAYPFLGYLIYRKTNIAWILFFGTILMAVTVLLMHVHYSIDVFAAFFITYGVYSFSRWIFDPLNIRFRDRLKIYGWNALRKMQKLKEKAKEKALENLIIK